MAGVPVIDLDVGPDGPAPESSGAGRGRIVSRPVVAMILAAIVVAAVAGDRRPDPGLREVLAAGGTAAAAFELGRDTLYTASYGVNINPNSESGLRRYDLRTGAEVWAVALPQGVQNLVVDDDAGVLMARSGTDPRISFLDTATGKVLWTSEGANTSASSLAGGGVLFITDEPGATVVRLADLRTGHTRWSRRIETQIYFGPDLLWNGSPRRIVMTGADGSVVVLDLGTGRELARGDLGGPLRPAWDGNADGVLIGTVGDNRMVVRRRTGGRLTMSAYSLVPFAPLWTRTAEPMGLASECGVAWCVTGDLPTLSAVDPATGEVLWTRPDLAFGFPFDDRRLIAGDALEVPVISVIDAATGRSVRPLGTVVSIGDLLLHKDMLARGTRVQELDESGVPHTLGTVDVAAPFGCESQDRYLACPTTSGPTRVWRVP